jgi:hypothetical protein
MTQQTRADLKADADTDLADNVSEDIVPQDVRDLIKNLADSAYFKSDETGLITTSVIAVQAFTSSDTYNKTTGAKTALVFATGGGGGGGDSTISAGGGAGATAIAFVDLAAVTSQTVTIGAAGATNGGNGGSTSFGSHAVAGGGTGGSSGGSGLQNGGAGGTASAGLVLMPGGRGADAAQAGSGDSNAPGGASFWGGTGARGSGGRGHNTSGNTVGFAGFVLVIEFG